MSEATIWQRANDEWVQLQQQVADMRIQLAAGESRLRELDHFLAIFTSYAGAQAAALEETSYSAAADELGTTNADTPADELGEPPYTGTWELQAEDGTQASFAPETAAPSHSLMGSHFQEEVAREEELFDPGRAPSAEEQREMERLDQLLGLQLLRRS